MKQSYATGLGSVSRRKDVAGYHSNKEKARVPLSERTNMPWESATSNDFLKVYKSQRQFESEGDRAVDAATLI